MRSIGLAGVRLRRRHRTTVADPAAVKAPDLIGRDCTASEPNTKYVGDITQLPLEGGKFLFSQRGGPYGRGRWHMPSGKLDEGEPLSVGAARELYEETGVIVDPAHLRLVQVVHHRQDEETTRIGFFYEATEWEGAPVNKEPEKCLALEWFSVSEPPDDVIEYPEKGLLGYLNGASPIAEHGWQ